MECVWDDGSYDSADDPNTGSYDKCSGAGGVWVEPSYFQSLGLGDWSSTGNSFLQGIYDEVDWGDNPLGLDSVTVNGTPFAANNGTNPITSPFRLITKSDYCRGGDRTINYWLVDTSTGGMPSSNWWVTEHIQAPVPTNSGGTNNTPNQYLDWLSNGGAPYNALQSFTVSQGSGAPSYPVYVTIGGQHYGTLGLWMSNNPLRNGQPSPNSVNCPPQ